jgi:Zn-dependent protease with chaperone function
MDSKAFETLVTRFEGLAARNPLGYRWRVFGVAILGYVYLALVILLLLAVTVLGVCSVVFLKAAAVKLVFFAGAPLVLVLRALWIRIEAPGGLRLTRENVPGLFKVLDDLRQRLNTPPLHNVLLSHDFNACVSQVPRLGLLGWHKNYLVVGLPLMKALSVEQFRAVLAHELGHLSRGHARASNWIYRLRRIWQQLDEAFSRTSHWGAALIRPFFKRYIPYFAAMSFPLARANEYEADAASVQLTSARAAAQALTSTSVIDAYFTERYWPAIRARAQDIPQPAVAPFSDFAVTAVQEVPVQELQRWQETALAMKTSHDDTHPSLTDRLKGIGAEAEFAPPASGESAERLLGPAASGLQSAFDEAWRKDVADSWRKTYESTRTARERLAELRSRAAQEELDVSSSVQLAGLEEELGNGPAAALAMLRELAQKHPGSLAVRFSIAGQLLRSCDAEGVEAMESVIREDVDALVPGAQLLRDYYVDHGDLARAIEWHQRYIERASEIEAAQQERNTLDLSDVLVGHQLSSEQLTKLITQLRQIPQLTGVYLVRKRTQHAAEVPLYVLAFKVQKWWSLRDAALTQAVQQRIKQEVLFPGETLIVSIEGRNSRFSQKFRRVKDARII